MTKNIRTALRVKRIENGLTQTEFAEKIGVSLGTVTGWERAKYTPTADKIVPIADALNVSVEEVVRMFN